LLLLRFYSEQQSRPVLLADIVLAVAFAWAGSRLCHSCHVVNSSTSTTTGRPQQQQQTRDIILLLHHHHHQDSVVLIDRFT
jgi:hypothetical protein